MVKITLVASYPEMAELAEQVFEESDYLLDPELEHFEVEYVLETVVADGIQIAEKEFDADVLMARGTIATALKRRRNYIPVVEMYVGGTDILRTFREARERYGEKRIGLASCPNTIIEANGLCSLLDLNIDCYKVTHPGQYREAVIQARDSGCGIVVAGPVGCRTANEIGLDAVILKSGRESIRKAATEAKRMGYISFKEQEKSKLFQSILDHSHDGIIALDGSDRITVANTMACKILGIQAKHALGESSETMIPRKFRLQALESSKTLTDELAELRDVKLTVSSSPIRLKGDVVGKLAVFQDVTRVQELEGRIRNKLYTQGHVARYTFDDIVGRNHHMQDCIRFAHRLCRLVSNVLITGDTGTGKELIAQSIHNESSRNRGPFVAINCAALPEELLESELFGYAEGAFTGAKKGGKPGLFELGHRGTVFLDEIGEMSTRIQSRLLRVIQEKQIMRLGDDKVIPVDVRIISATNKDLMRMVEEGNFRSDLYYRIDVMNIKLPSLNERRDDIPLLIDHFFDKFRELLGCHKMELSAGALRLLVGLEYRGNIRELENTCERLVSLSEGDVLREDDVRKILYLDKCEEACSVPKADFADALPEGEHSAPRHNGRWADKNDIEHILQSVRYNKVKAAQQLGVSRSTLYRWLEKFEIQA